MLACSSQATAAVLDLGYLHILMGEKCLTQQLGYINIILLQISMNSMHIFIKATAF